MGELYLDNIERRLPRDAGITNTPVPEIFERITGQPRVMPGMFTVYGENDYPEYCG